MTAMSSSPTALASAPRRRTAMVGGIGERRALPSSMSQTFTDRRTRSMTKELELEEGSRDVSSIDQAGLHHHHNFQRRKQEEVDEGAAEVAVRRSSSMRRVYGQSDPQRGLSRLGLGPTHDPDNPMDRGRDTEEPIRRRRFQPDPRRRPGLMTFDEEDSASPEKEKTNHRKVAQDSDFRFEVLTTNHSPARLPRTNSSVQRSLLVSPQKVPHLGSDRFSEAPKMICAAQRSQSNSSEPARPAPPIQNTHSNTAYSHREDYPVRKALYLSRVSPHKRSSIDLQNFKPSPGKASRGIFAHEIDANDARDKHRVHSDASPARREYGDFASAKEPTADGKSRPTFRERMEMVAAQSPQKQSLQQPAARKPAETDRASSTLVRSRTIGQLPRAEFPTARPADSTGIADLELSAETNTALKTLEASLARLKAGSASSMSSSSLSRFSFVGRSTETASKGNSPPKRGLGDSRPGSLSPRKVTLPPTTSAASTSTHAPTSHGGTVSPAKSSLLVQRALGLHATSPDKQSSRLPNAKTNSFAQQQQRPASESTGLASRGVPGQAHRERSSAEDEAERGGKRNSTVSSASVHPFGAYNEAGGSSRTSVHRSRENALGPMTAARRAPPVSGLTRSKSTALGSSLLSRARTNGNLASLAEDADRPGSSRSEKVDKMTVAQSAEMEEAARERAEIKAVRRTTLQSYTSVQGALSALVGEDRVSSDAAQTILETAQMTAAEEELARQKAEEKAARRRSVLSYVPTKRDDRPASDRSVLGGPDSSVGGVSINSSGAGLLRSVSRAMLPPTHIPSTSSDANSSSLLRSSPPRASQGGDSSTDRPNRSADSSLVGNSSSATGAAPAKLRFLRGLTILVDVRDQDGEDAGTAWIEMLKGAGAKVLVRAPSANTERALTHIVFKSGRPATLHAFRSQPDPKPLVVGVAWVLKCMEAGKRADEREYLVEVGKQAVFNTKRSSMAPRAAPNCPVKSPEKSGSAVSAEMLEKARRRSLLHAPVKPSPLRFRGDISIASTAASQE